MSIFSSDSIITWLDTLAGYTYQMALHSSDPLLAANPANTEISNSSGYARQNVTFARNSLTLWNTGAVTFTGLPSVTITHVAAWYTSGPNNTKMAFAVPLNSSVIASSNSSWSIAANEFVIYL